MSIEKLMRLLHTIKPGTSMMLVALVTMLFCGCNLEVIPSTDETGGSANVFVHVASGGVNKYTELSNSLVDNNPDAILIITANLGGSFARNAESPAVYYYNDKWWITNPATALADGMEFNVLVKKVTDSDAFIHTALASTITGKLTALDHPSLNGNSSMRVFVTPSLEYGGVNPSTSPLGVAYINNKWNIVNLNGTTIPVNSRYNVYFTSSSTTSFVHTVTTFSVSDTYQDLTFIDDTHSNGKSAAKLFITPTLGTSSTVYNQPMTGVWYSPDDGKWSIFNEDNSEMPVNAAFNVLVQ